MKNKSTGIIAIILCCFYFSSTLVSCRNEKEHVIEQQEREGEEEGEEENKKLSGANKQLANIYLTAGYPNPENLTGKYMKAWKEVQALQANFNGLSSTPLRTTSGMGNWTDIGPKIFGGRVLTLAINPISRAGGLRTIFAGSASGGIWRSFTNGAGGTAWHSVETKLPVLGVSSIVYKPGGTPADTMILLAGTGEVYRIDTVINGANNANQVANIGRNVWKARGTYGIGILKSVDGGNNWTHALIKDTSDLFGVAKIKFDPTNSTIVYAATTDGVYKSTNTGTSWTRVFTITNVMDVVIDPANNQRILISVGNLDRRDKSLWRSLDGGTTWTKLTPASFPVVSATQMQYKGFVSLTVAGTAAPYTVFAGVGKGDVTTPNSYTDNEVYSSTDFGTTWTLISNSNHSRFQAWFAHCLTPFPVAGGTSTTKIFMAGVDKYVLGIAGATGTRTTIGGGGATMGSYLAPSQQEGGGTYVHSDVHDVQFVPGSLSEAYFATDGGIFRTQNANVATISSMTFTSCNGGLQIHQFYPTVAQSQTNNSLLVGGLQDNNVIRSRGTNWAKVIGGDGGPCMFMAGNEAVLLGSTDSRGVSRSSDSGKNYGGNVLAYLGSITVPRDDRTAFMAPLGVSIENPNRWYSGSDMIHISDDAGASFTNSSATPPMGPYIAGLHKPAIAIGVSQIDADVLYVSISPFSQNTTTWGLNYNPPAMIRKSINGGTSFTNAHTGLPDRIYTDFAISRTNHDSLYVTLGGFGVAHVYVSGNGGTSWTPRSNGLPDVPFNTILIDPANTNIMYAGCDFGVYVTSDKGANWYPFNNGFTDANYVIDLVFAPTNKVRAITHGKGIFEADKWSGLVTLPVNFRSFTGVNRGNLNELVWNVDQESNLSHYILERSTDGYNYQPIKNTTARNSTAPTSYSHNDPLGANPSPVYYYRVKSVNLDGSYMFSEIVMIKISNKGKFEVLGNPFTNNVTIRYTVNQTDNLHLSLYDMQGKLLRKEELMARTGTGTHTISNLSALPAGIYLLNLEMDRNKTVIKLLKR